MRNNIWAVIITYNPDIQQLRKLLEVLTRNNVVIVDNSENHDSIRTLSVDKILNETNTGFAKGVNQGLEYCLNKGAAWVIVLNQDILFKRAELDNFCDHLLRTSAKILGPVAGILDTKRWTTILDSKSNNIDYITASFIAIHKDVVDKIGLFYEKYFMYYEDVDYCIRAKKFNFSLEKVNFRSFMHNESSSLGKNSIKHNYYLARNHLLFVERLAPIRVKLYELIRLPKTIYEFYTAKNKGGILGIKDYFLRKFGEFSY